jgi:hypothetical protein
LGVKALAESFPKFGHKLGSSVRNDRPGQSVEPKDMLQKEFRQLFGRSGVSTVYQVAHFRESARDYQYSIVAIRPGEPGNKVHRKILPGAIGNR